MEMDDEKVTDFVKIATESSLRTRQSKPGPFCGKAASPQTTKSSLFQLKLACYRVPSYCYGPLDSQAHSGPITIATACGIVPGLRCNRVPIAQPTRNTPHFFHHEETRPNMLNFV